MSENENEESPGGEDRFDELRAQTLTQLQAFIGLVERTGAEIPVILIVSGREVHGHLTPYRRFQGFIKEFFDAVEEGKPLTATEAGPIPHEEIDELLDEREELDSGEEEADIAYKSFVLRDATVRTGVPATNLQRNYLVLDATSVDGMSLGEPSYE